MSAVFFACKGTERKVVVVQKYLLLGSAKQNLLNRTLRVLLHAQNLRVLREEILYTQSHCLFVVNETTIINQGVLQWV